MLWKTEEYLLVGVFYDICMIDRSRFKNKPIIFEISLGNAGNQQFYQNQTVQVDEDCRSENGSLYNINSHFYSILLSITLAVETFLSHRSLNYSFYLSKTHIISLK